MNEKEKAVIVYTDGGCHGNPGPGGWACIILSSDNRIEKRGFEAATTNNRMELTAVITALETILSSTSLQKSSVELHTDSQYVRNGITSWISGWIKKGWKTASGSAVKNRELWERLKQLDDRLTVTWRWVRGHDGNELNEACDALVQQAIREGK
ncbi:ribonuclease HI [Sediminispirochaeta bajacaliforniensis]|uniref:ribonuclease HI n=1 Tax=Sediminispirochaeta bajacaliforniensis TaxID=148 RepID=UPI00035FA6EC|nr:ribonuclease HI [Sediminispirochaeta bajacaliforniensis]